MAIAQGEFTIVEVNDIDIATTEPVSPVVDQLWLDSSGATNILRRWNGTSWVAVGADVDLDGIYEQIDTITPFIAGTHTTSTANWTGVAPFATLQHGQQITYLLNQVPTGNATLNLTLSGGGTTGAINCYYGGTTRLTTHYSQGNIIRFTYLVDNRIGATNYTGWWADSNYDTNTIDRLQYAMSITAGSAITAGYLLAASADGKFHHMIQNRAFDITQPILYSQSAIALNATGSNNYYVWGSGISIRSNPNNAGLNFTTGKTLYLQGTLNGVMFTPNTANLFTDNPTDVNAIYMVMGKLHSTYQINLLPQHELYKFDGGVFKSFAQIAAETRDYVDVQIPELISDIAEVGSTLTGLQNFTNTAFEDSIISYAEKEALKTHIQYLDTEKKDVDTKFTKIYNDTFLSGTPKTALNTAKTNYNNTYTTLIAAINTAVADDTISAAERTAVETGFTNYRTNLGTLTEKLEEAIRAIETSKIDRIAIGGANLYSISDTITAYNSETTGTTVTTSYPEYQVMESLIEVTNYTQLTYQVWNPNLIVNSQSINKLLWFDASQVYISASTIPLLSGAPYQIMVFNIPVNAKFVKLAAVLGARNTEIDSAIRVKFEFGDKGTDWQMSQTDYDLILKGRIDDSIDEVYEAIQGIRGEVAENYVTNVGLEAYKTNISTSISQNATAFNLKFDTVYNDLSQLDDATRLQFENISKYIRFENGKIILGQTNSSLTLEIANDRIRFLQGGFEVAYFSNNTLYVTDGNFLKSMKIGNFAFTPRSNGNLSFGKVT